MTFRNVHNTFPNVLRWLWKVLWGSSEPKPGLNDLIDWCRGLEQRLDYLEGDIVKLRGRQTGALRNQGGSGSPSADPAASHAVGAQRRFGRV